MLSHDSDACFDAIIASERRAMRAALSRYAPRRQMF